MSSPGPPFLDLYARSGGCFGSRVLVVGAGSPNTGAETHKIDEQPWVTFLGPTCAFGWVFGSRARSVPSTTYSGLVVTGLAEIAIQGLLAIRSVGIAAEFGDNRAGNLRVA